MITKTTRRRRRRIKNDFHVRRVSYCRRVLLRKERTKKRLFFSVCVLLDERRERKNFCAQIFLIKLVFALFLVVAGFLLKLPQNSQEEKNNSKALLRDIYIYTYI